MTEYYKIMAGRASSSVDYFIEHDIIGVNFGVQLNLDQIETEDFYIFSETMHKIYWNTRKEVSKSSAGLTNGQLWKISKRIKQGDKVLMPAGRTDGSIYYRIGEIIGDYYYDANEDFPHRRAVKWTDTIIYRKDMNKEMQNSFGTGLTLTTLTKYATEIELLAHGEKVPVFAPLPEQEDIIEDPTGFALENHLEEFLVRNWGKTELGQEYDIYFTEEDGEIGQQFPTDTGNIDILAISKDKKKFLIVELKRGRASDVVVGQIQRYMGYVKEVLANEEQNVHGIIIALEDDLRIRRALSVTNNIEFYQYRIDFHLAKKI